MSADGRDRLSALPDELLHHILSFIHSTKLHAQTSVLAKRWRHLWARHPNLHFSMPYPKSFNEPEPEETESIAKSYVSWVDRCLLSVDPPSLDRVSIDLWLPTSCSPAESKAHSKTADRWLRFAGLGSARKLSVQVRTETGRWYGRGRIPLSLFCCRFLTDLNVNFSTFPDVPAKFQGFRNLTKLLISCGTISNEAVADLLDGCPLLEDLKLIGLVRLRYVEISPRSSPRLKHLLLSSYYEYGKWMRVSIDAPNLSTIHLGASLPELEWKGSEVLNQAELTSKAEEDFKSFDDWMVVVTAVSNARVLKVNYWFYQFVIRKNYVSGPLFKNLKDLHCDIDWITGSVLRSLAYGLGECPLLEKLVINLNGHVRSHVKDSVEKASNEAPEDTPDGYILPTFRHTDALLKLVEDEHEKDGWNPFEHFDELDYFLHHLKIITVEEFLGSKNEMQLLGFLLGKATALELFIVFDLLMREEWELDKVFATVRRASSQVQMKLSQWDNLKYRFPWWTFGRRQSSTFGQSNNC